MKSMAWMTMLMISICLIGISSVQALDETKVRITLSNDLPPISDNLAIYVREIDTETSLTGTGNPIGTDRTVGFNQTNIGGGPGMGNNEKIPYSFVFPPFASIRTAQLEIELTPNGAIFTDFLLFADRRLPEHAGYGNAVLNGLAGSSRVTVLFDLKQIDKVDVFTQDHLGTADVSDALLDGTLDVIYADDAIVHRATLIIRGFAREPGVEFLNP